MLFSVTEAKRVHVCMETHHRQPHVYYSRAFINFEVPDNSTTMGNLRQIIPWGSYSTDRYK